MKIITKIAEFVSDPLNILIFFLIWVGLPIVASDETPSIKLIMVVLMLMPATLGYVAGRRK